MGSGFQVVKGDMGDMGSWGIWGQASKLLRSCIVGKVGAWELAEFCDDFLDRVGTWEYFRNG
jgi:hypothetical protein